MQNKNLSIFILILFCLLTSCESTSPGTSDDDGDSSSGGNWSEAGEALTIDDIVNGDGSGSSLTKEVATSSSAAFYFGRFLFYDGTYLFTGSVKFKLNKNDDSSAYFSDFTMEHYSEVTGADSHSNIVTSSTDLAVSGAFDASDNHVEIADATERFVAFDLDFGDNDYFGDITSAGVIFSSDFTTMAGGDCSNFFFIAQKVASQPDVSVSALLGDYSGLNFAVNCSTGGITLENTFSVTAGGTGPNGFTAFTGTNSEDGTFSGETALTDSTSGAFLFSYDGLNTAGAFLVSADQSLALGIDVTSGLYFAAER